MPSENIQTLIQLTNNLHDLMAQQNIKDKL